MRNRKYTLSIGVFILPYLLYTIGIYFLMKISGVSFNNVVIFRGYPQIDWQSIFINILISVSALVIAYIMPGLPWALGYLKSKQDGFYTILAKSFVLSFIIQIILSTLYKSFLQTPLTRTSFILILFIPCIIGWFLLMKSKMDIPYFLKCLKKIDYIKWMMSLLFIAIISFYLKDKLLIEPFNDDAMEIADLTRSLTRHIFPYWNFEHDIGSSFGWVFFVPPLSSFFHFPLFMLLGESEFAMRLAHIGCFFVLPMIIYKLCLLDIEKRNIYHNLKLVIFLIILLGIASYILITCFYVFNNLYHHCDLVMNIGTFLITFTFIAIYFLFKNRLLLFLTFSLIASFLLWYGVIFFTIFLLTFSLFYRRNFTYLWYYLGCFILSLTVLANIAYMKGYLFINIYSFRQEYFGYLSNIPHHWHIEGLFNKGSLLSMFFYYTGGLVVMMFISFKRDKFYGLFFLTFLLFFYFIFSCIRYSPPGKVYVFSLVAFFPLLVLVHRIYTSENKKIVLFLIICTYSLLLFSFYTIIPRKIQLEMYPKEIGRITYMDFENYEDAVSASRTMLPYAIQEQFIKDRVTVHSWIYYSDLGNGIKNYHIYCLSSHPVWVNKGYKLLLEKSGYYLFCKQNPKENRKL